MEKSNIDLNDEFRLSAQYMSLRLKPAPGAIPQIPGIDIYGITLPFNGIVGGDLITYVNFQDRYDLDARIQRALAKEQTGKVQCLQRLKHKGGILLADVAGHDLSAAARALMLHQAFHTAALYEMDLNGEITVRLFEQINTRFCKSSTLRNLAAVPDLASFITLIYGEISNSGRFRFVSAGHPLPLVFSREFDRFVLIRPDRLVSYPPIGLQPSEDHADANRYQRPLGYKKRYTINELNLMGKGDVLLLYTDGLLDPITTFTQNKLEKIVSKVKDGTARDICKTIIKERCNTDEQIDDISLVVIKYN